MTSSENESAGASDRYWRQSLNVVYFILGIWAFISLGCGILLRDTLDSLLPNIGNAPFGFWMAQQGAIIGFLTLLVVYMLLMNRLDRKHGFDEDESV
jgi:putative solute:sodium symporter small subunit